MRGSKRTWKQNMSPWFSGAESAEKNGMTPDCDSNDISDHGSLLNWGGGET
jgi:hypothetical protein